MFDPFLKAIAWVLAQIYSVVPDLGVSIIVLTLLIMLLLYPLTAKQAKSMIAMQRVQPEIKKLQAKYKGDRQKMNEELMKFYQEHKINPLAGCLPLLVQLPILFSLFRVLRDSYKYLPKSSDLYQKFCSPISICADVKGHTPKPHHLGFISKDFLDLNATATDHHGAFLASAMAFVLVIGVVVVGFLQTRQAQKRTPAANKQMATVMKVLPVFFAFISLTLPSGVVLYYFISSLWRLGQQELVFRKFYERELPGAARKRALEEAIDVDSVDTTETVVDEAPKAIRPRAAKPTEPKPAAKPRPAAKSPPAAAPSPAPSPPARSGNGAPTGGLRRLFQLPPPPDATPPPRPTPRAKPAPTKSSSRPGARKSSAAKKRRKR